MFAGIYGQSIPAEMSLSEFAYGFSPLVEATARNTVVIDVEGCELLFGSAYQLAEDITRRAAQTEGGLGCKVNVALAGNPDAAIHAAKFCKGITFTSPGEELTCLGGLQIKLIQFSLVGVEEKRALEILETLQLWGIRTFREFAELPIAGVSERLGQEGVKLQELAAGKTNRHLKLLQGAPVFGNSIDLEYPIAQLEALSFIFARLLNQICANLNAYALATNDIQVELKLESGGVHNLRLTLPYPMRDHKVFLKLLLLDTEAHPPPAAVTAIKINCEPVKPRLLQSGLFIPLAPEPEKLELTLARLAKLVGLENIGSPELLDTHRPDAFRIKRFVLQEGKRRKGKQQSAISSQQSVMGFRMFRPPLRALVQADPGYPTELSAWDKSRSVYGKVVAVAGPWRTTGDWWRTDMWSRDEWDVVLEEGRAEKNSGLQTIYRIYRELGSGTWFVEGMYD